VDLELKGITPTHSVTMFLLERWWKSDCLSRENHGY